MYFFFFSSRRRHTRYWRDWSSDVCSSDLTEQQLTFDGSPSVTLQPGEEVRSDAVPMELSDAEAQRSNVAVSLHLEGASGPMTWHAASFTTLYVTDPGSREQTCHVTDEAIPHSPTKWLSLS